MAIRFDRKGFDVGDDQVGVILFTQFLYLVDIAIETRRATAVNLVQKDGYGS